MSCASGGTHGLEHETFQRVKREGVDWIVSDRNGVESHYAPSQSAALRNVRWTLDYRTDPSGNRVDYHRWCDGNDECYLDDIAYHDASDPGLHTRIEYRWEKRPNEAAYAADGSSLVHVRFRLQSIVVWTDGHVRSALDVGYRSTQTGRWSGASAISTITHYGSDVVFDAQGRIIGGSHLPAEIYATVGGAAPSDMAAKTVTFKPDAPPASSAWDQWTFRTTLKRSTDAGQQQWTALDVNGDGLDDSVATVYHGPGDPGTTDLVIHINRGDGTFRDPVTIPTGWAYWYPPPFSGSDAGQTVVAGDFNGDGLKDLMAIWTVDSSFPRPVKAQVAFGTPTVKLVTLGPVITLPVAEWSNDHRWLVGDQDGDRRDDLIIVEQKLSPGCDPTTTRSCTSPQIHVLRSDGPTFTELPQSHPNWTDAADETPYWFMGEIDGDGRADIIRIESVFGPNGRTARIGIARSTGAGSFTFSTYATQAPWTPLVFPSRFGWRPIGADLAKVGDFDGNGLNSKGQLVFGPTVAATPGEAD